VADIDEELNVNTHPWIPLLSLSNTPPTMHKIYLVLLILKAFKWLLFTTPDESKVICEPIVAVEFVTSTVILFAYNLFEFS
jgi:hypothetical protein